MRFPKNVITDEKALDSKYLRLYILDKHYLKDVFQYWKVQYKTKYTNKSTKIDLDRIKESICFYVPKTDASQIDAFVSQITRVMNNKLHLRNINDDLDPYTFNAFAEKYFTEKLEACLSMLTVMLGKVNHRNIIDQKISTNRLTPDTVVAVGYCNAAGALVLTRSYEKTSVKYDICIKPPSHQTEE